MPQEGEESKSLILALFDGDDPVLMYWGKPSNPSRALLVAPAKDTV